MSALNWLSFSSSAALYLTSFSSISSRFISFLLLKASFFAFSLCTASAKELLFAPIRSAWETSNSTGLLSLSL